MCCLCGVFDGWHSSEKHLRSFLETVMMFPGGLVMEYGCLTPKTAADGEVAECTERREQGSFHFAARV